MEFDGQAQTNFRLTNDDDTESFVVGFNESEDLDIDFGNVIDKGTRNFNLLYNRPFYDEELMTGDTRIPKVPEGFTQDEWDRLWREY